MPVSISQNPYLSGDYAPIQDELELAGLPVKGKIPADLNGIYMRNGPNPAFPPLSYTYLFDGDGMIHAIYLQDGNASYRNRYVATKGLLAEQRVGHAIYGGVSHPVLSEPELIGPHDDPGPIKNGAFIHIIRHAKQYLAMSESSPAYAITAKLATLGEYAPNGKKPLNLGPHTRLDPLTGELFLICYQETSPYLIYYKMDAKGNLINSTSIDKPYATMMHDFVLTQNHIIFIDCPAVMDINAFTTGGEFFSWRPELGTRIGLLSRHDSKQMIKWIQIEPFFVFHFANAYDVDNKIIINYVQHANLKFGTHEKSTSWPTLHQITIDLKSGQHKNEKLDDNSIEFPRIHENYSSLPNRYVYTPAKNKSCLADLEKVSPFSILIKYDIATGKKAIHNFGADCEIDEAVFAPRKDSIAEDDGYIMLFVYHKKNNSSSFVILDAQHLATEPIASIELPRRIPHGLHGSWFPDA